jgi:hypothetical protein
MLFTVTESLAQPSCEVKGGNTMLRRINRKLDKWTQPDTNGKTPLIAAFEGAVMALWLLALYSMLGLFD